MNLMVLVISLVIVVVVAALFWIGYRHFKKIKKDKVNYIKSEQKIAVFNLEEVNLKALEKPKESLGKLVYAIKYLEESQSLRVTVKSGHDLNAVSTGGTTDPYVKIWLKDNPKIKLETKVKKRTLNPIFNEEFTFTVPEEELSRQTIIFFLYDFDRFSKHEPIGCLMIELHSLDLSKTIEDWAELDPPNSDVNHEIPLGDLCISLKYDPDEEKLFVTILEGKDLKKHEEEDLYDPYVMVAIEEGGKIIKKKLTSIKKATPNPYFNEEFVFKLSADMATKAQLVITVLNCNGNTKNSLVIGNLVLGPSITGAGLKHWKEIIASPKRVIAHWHGLVELITKQK